MPAPDLGRGLFPSPVSVLGLWTCCLLGAQRDVVGHRRGNLGGRSESGWLSLLCLALSCFFPALLGVDQPCLIPAAGVSKSQVSIYDMHCYWGEGRSCHCNITGECWGGRDRNQAWRKTWTRRLGRWVWLQGGRASPGTF